MNPAAGCFAEMVRRWPTGKIPPSYECFIEAHHRLEREYGSTEWWTAAKFMLDGRWPT